MPTRQDGVENRDKVYLLSVSSSVKQLSLNMEAFVSVLNKTSKAIKNECVSQEVGVVCHLPVKNNLGRKNRQQAIILN